MSPDAHMLRIHQELHEAAYRGGSRHRPPMPATLALGHDSDSYVKRVLAGRGAGPAPQARSGVVTGGVAVLPSLAAGP